MTELKTYYKVTDGSCWCVVESEAEAKELIKNEAEWGGYSHLDLKTESVLLTEDQFNNLPEFEGF